MALTLAKTRSGVIGDLAYWLGTAIFDSTYVVGGESFTAANAGLSDIYPAASSFKIRGGGVATAVYDDANAKIKLFTEVIGPTLASDGETAATGLIQDDDNAATTGVIVYAVVDSDPGIVGAARGHFEFVSPTNVDGRAEWDATYKGQCMVIDNDAAATAGTAVRAIAAGAGLESTFAAALGAGGPLYVKLSGGGTGHANINFEDVYVKVAESTTASTPTLYFDEDAAEESERFMAVVVDNADETFPLYTVKGTFEVPVATDCSACIVDIFAVGTP